tara:strand:- start:131069 stop:131686 length:618 start_codon:yes stop_codon:yes gene_type:complete
MYTIQQLIAKSRENSIILIAASKKQSPQKIIAAKNAGILHFGENYIQEAIDKIDAFSGCNLHFIGHLQTNKAHEAVKYFDTIHSVDRLKLAKSLEKECIKQGRAQLNVFIQVNQGLEPTKAGCKTSELPDLLKEIRSLCPHINVIGLMTIPPKDKSATVYFKELSEIAKREGLTCTSMGMSDDYIKAIENGATHIRVGSAIFGTR